MLYVLFRRPLLNKLKIYSGTDSEVDTGAEAERLAVAAAAGEISHSKRRKVSLLT